MVNVKVVDNQPAVMIERTENSINEEAGPRRCDSRFRFVLRPFGASVETAHSGGFTHYTPSNGSNSDTFNEHPSGFLFLPNPFIINSTSEWTVSLYVIAFTYISYTLIYLSRLMHSGKDTILY